MHDFTRVESLNVIVLAVSGLLLEAPLYILGAGLGLEGMELVIKWKEF
jgi:hypothetical protein